MEQSRPTKRPRLSMACNECRRRKVKCDANYPQCKNCAQRKIECVTTDPKRPGAQVVREWIEDKQPAQSPQPNPAHNLDHTRSIPQRDGVQDGQVQRASGTQISEDHMDRLQGSNAPTSTLEEHQSETNEVSPVYNPYDMSFHMDQNTNRMKMMGASSSQCLLKSLDVYLELARVKTVAVTLKYGMRHAEEMTLPLVISLSDFPEINNRQNYIRAFFDRIHRLWPALDVDDTKSAIHAFASVSDLSAIPHEQVPLLASAYLVMSLGADEDAGRLTEHGNTYLQAATSLLGHLILMPYLSAVQSLILFTIAYRGRNKDGLAWQTAGMAVRIAHSLGLHKHSDIRPSKQHGVTEKRTQLFHARIWAICCCLEKIIQLESGRPSAIFQLNTDQMMEKDQRPRGHNFLRWNMGLAEFQNDIGRHIYGQRPGDRTAREILQNTARLDRALLDWSHQMPHEFQPENAMFCSNEEFHLAAFFAIQFHQAMITLHRAALIAPRGTFDAEVEKWCSEEPSKHRLQRGELICINSARAIVRLSLELSERKAESRVLTAGPPLLASVALAIFLMKHPRGRSQAADLELLKAAVEHTSDEYIKSGQDRRMAQGVLSIHDKVRLHFRSSAVVMKRSHGCDTANNPNAQGSTPSSKSGEVTGIDNNMPLDHQVTQRPTSAPHSNITSQSQIPTSSQYVLPASSTYRSPVSTAAERAIVLVSETSLHRHETLDATNGWTLPSASSDQAPQQYLGQSANDNFFDTTSLGQDGLANIQNESPDRLPFGEFSVEEMWKWMCQMDAMDNFPPITSFDPGT